MVTQIEVQASSIDEFRDSVILFLRDGDTLTKGDFPCKCKFLSQKGRESPALPFKKLKQSKIILTPKMHILGRHILPSHGHTPICLCIQLLKDILVL